MSLFDQARNLKNNFISKSLQEIINSKIETFGNIRDINIDTVDKNISAELLLKGETETVKIYFSQYEILEIEDKTYFKFNSLSTTKEWLNVLLQNYVLTKFAPENKILIEKQYSSFIKHLV